MKATEQYFPVVLFIMLYKVVLTFESVDEILKCDHSSESYYAVLSYGAVFSFILLIFRKLKSQIFLLFWMFDVTFLYLGCVSAPV